MCLTGCQCISDQSNTVVEDQRVSLYDKSGSPASYDPQAMALMHQFQKALIHEDWAQAIECCSDAINEAASKYEATEAFFQTVVPIPRLTLLNNLPICAYHTRDGAAGNTGSYYESFVRLMEGEGEFSVSWKWRALESPSGWCVDFSITPLDEVIKQEVERRHTRLNEYRDSIIPILPAIAKIKLQLSAAKHRYRLGEPVVLRLELANNSDMDLAYDGQQVRVNHSLIVRDENGKEVPYTAGPVQTCGGDFALPSGQKVVLFDGLDISQQYALDKPGRYTVQFRRGLTISVAMDNQQFEDRGLHSLPCHDWPSNTVLIELTH